ncbi:MAG: hypothetical protein JNM31_06075 [Flavobacteriales bacterium]|nr:hypothetical protein [Flavobacteriales bacterium]
MKKRHTILVMGSMGLLAAFQGGAAKELIRNGGFEWTEGKVYTFDQLKLAQGWSNATIGISEVFSPEATVKTVGIPTNEYGTMKPLEGEKYAGFFAWKDDERKSWSSDPEEPFKPGWNSYSEYLQSELVEPLVEGRTYELSFHVALSGNSDRAVSGIGAYLAPNRLDQPHRRFLREAPQVFQDSIIDARSEWREVHGTFKADGGERFILIGVYPFVGFETKRMIEGLDNKYAYYYIDKISLKEVKEQK